MVKNTQAIGKKAGVLLAFGALLSACSSTPEPVEPAAPVVQTVPAEIVIYEPEPEPVVEEVPSIDIAEWERMQAEEAAANAVIVETPAPVKAPVVKKTPLERAAEASDPDKAIKILMSAEDSPEKSAMLLASYQAKLAADKEAGNAKGEAEALVYLAKLEAGSDNQATQIGALKKFAQAQSLDPQNEAAPGEVSTLRSKLQSYADALHKQAVTYFVEQDFEPAVSRWETVLLIDPGNSAARNWFKQASEALGR